MRTYEIVAYHTEQDFNNRKGDVLDEGISNKKEALKLAQSDYGSGRYYALKCQSSDREFIQMYPAVFKSI